MKRNSSQVSHKNTLMTHEVIGDSRVTTPVLETKLN